MNGIMVFHYSRHASLWRVQDFMFMLVLPTFSIALERPRQHSLGFSGMLGRQ